jgi:hypothetical protein
MPATLIATLVALGLAIPYAAPQTAAPGDPVTEARQTVSAARKAMDEYAAAGGKAGAPDHPALTWDATLWAYRDRYPGTDAAAIGTAEAVRVLMRAEFWDRAHARADSVGVDDRAWERLATVIYEEGIARKDLPYTIERLSRVVRDTTSASNKAATLIVVGRAYRRQGDKEAATRSLEAAKAAAPGSPYAEEAEGLIYEIVHLSEGVQAPAIDGTSRDGRRITLTGLRGKPIVLVFWGTT